MSSPVWGGWGWWGLGPEVASCDTPPLFQSHFLKTMAIVQAISPARTRSRGPANVHVAADIQMQNNSAWFPQTNAGWNIYDL